MIKIGYLIQNQELIHKLHACYTLDHEILMMALKTDSEKEWVDLGINVVIFDFGDADGVRLDRFEKVKSKLGIRGICIVESYSKLLVDLILKHRIQFYCDSHISVEGLKLLVMRLISEGSLIQYSPKELIEKGMQDTQIPNHLKGFEYLKTALFYMFDHENQIFTVQEIYQAIAYKHQTTQTRVERNIRKAIASASETKSIERMSNYKYMLQLFKHCKEKKDD